MISISVSDSSVRDLQRSLGTITQNVIRGGIEGSYQNALAILDKAQQSAPIVSGALRDSGKVTVNEAAIRATISYGDSSRNPDGIETRKYAELRHETPNRKNPFAYKWLERTLFEEEPEMILQRYAESIRGNL